MNTIATISLVVTLLAFAFMLKFGNRLKSELVNAVVAAGVIGGFAKTVYSLGIESPTVNGWTWAAVSVMCICGAMAFHLGLNLVTLNKNDLAFKRLNAFFVASATPILILLFFI